MKHNINNNESYQDLSLWKAMESAVNTVSTIGGPMYAAEIRAIRDWLIPNDKMTLPPTAQAGEYHRWCERQRLYKILTNEIIKAKQSDQSTISINES